MNLSSSKSGIYDILSFIMSRSTISMVVAIMRLGTMYSIIIIDSYPYTNLKSVFPVDFLHVVLYAHNTARILKSQSSLFTSHTLINAFYKILLITSIVPFS